MQLWTGCPNLGHTTLENNFEGHLSITKKTISLRSGRKKGKEGGRFVEPTNFWFVKHFSLSTKSDEFLSFLFPAPPSEDIPNIVCAHGISYQKYYLGWMTNAPFLSKSSKYVWYQNMQDNKRAQEHCFRINFPNNFSVLFSLPKL